MKCKDRLGNIVGQNETQNQVLAALYETVCGRMILSVLVRPWVSKLVGRVLNLPISKVLIDPFVRRNHIDISEYEEREFKSYNDFFTRKIKDGRRPIDCEKTHLIAPCDSKLSVYSIDEQSSFYIKNTYYSMKSLVRSEKLAKHYEGGTLLLFRLTVEDYHRFCYVDEGQKTKNYTIPGVFHTVNPLANDVVPIYKENTREFSILKSEHFGNVLMMEVGAMMVGKIDNYHEEKMVCRGEEKGKFEFGGSTVILCLEKNRVDIDRDILYNTEQGIETVVKMGEKIGTC